MSQITRASELLLKLIAMERQHGPDSLGVWDVVTELRTQLELLPTAEVFALIFNSRDLVDDKGYWACVLTLQHRGDQETFDTCAAWVRDESAEKRHAAADILADLGYLVKNPFSAESWTLLEPLLADGSPFVVASALSACGKLKIGDPSVLATFVRHANRDVRFAAVRALSGRDDPISNDGLITLSRDDEPDVRNWATFGLGQLTEFDTPEIRAALIERIDDRDPGLGSEIRGEALIGLARRGDLRVLEPLKRELVGEFHGAWAIEAAHDLKDPTLKPLLIALKRRLDTENVHVFGEELDRAIAACSPTSA